MTIAQASLLEPRRLPVGRFVVLSVGVHAAVVVLLFAWTTLLGGPRVNLDQKPIKATLVRLGKPRDEKLLPREETAPPPAPAPVAAPPPVTPPAPAPNAPSLTPKAAAKPAADSRASKSALFDAFNKTARAGKAEPLEGQLDGDVNGDAAKAEGERYFALLVMAIKRRYDVPNTIPEAERIRLKALVRIKIGAGGELIEKSLSTSSGNALYDDAVLSAINKAAPFSPPPPHLRAALKGEGQTFEFTP